MPAQTETINGLSERFSGITTSEFRDRTRVVVAKDQLIDVLTYLKGQQGFDYLVDLTCVDYLHYRDATDRFGLVYLLANSETNERLVVRTMFSEPDLAVPSVVSLWAGANWLEREVWDLFGIQFQGHPDLRRIVLPERFSAHPLRKDYPLQGRGERHNFPVLARGGQT